MKPTAGFTVRPACSRVCVRSGGLFQSHQALVLGLQIVARPDTTNAHGADGNAFKGQLVRDTEAAMGGLHQTVLEHRLLDLFADAIGVWATGARQAINQALRATGLEVAADLVELLAGVAHYLAGFGDVAQILGQF